MPYGAERFNLDEALDSIGQALSAIVCHVGFDAALHGLLMALLVGALGLLLRSRGRRFGQPLLSVCRKLSLFCLLLLIPGLVCLVFSGHLPSTGSFQINSLGFIVFWSLICLHLSAEEMNFQWF